MEKQAFVFFKPPWAPGSGYAISSLSLPRVLTSMWYFWLVLCHIWLFYFLQILPPLYSLLFLLILLQTEGFPRRCQLKADTSNPKKKKRHHNTICIYEAKCKTDAQKRVETSSVSDLMISFLAEHLQKKKKKKRKKILIDRF